MSEQILLGPREDLIRAIAAQIPAGITDLSRIAVVFPGKRPAHFLRRELARRIGQSFIPPRIFAIEDFVSHIVEQVHGGPVRPLERLDAAAILFDLHKGFPERLGEAAFQTLDAFLPIGLKLFGELEELRQAGWDEKTVVEKLQSISFDQRHTLAAYYREFYAKAAALGLTTRAMGFAEAADRLPELPLSEFDRILVAGLFRLTRTEQRIVDELSRREQVVLVFQTDKMDADAPRPEVTLTSAPDVHGQVFALAARMKERLERPGQLDERTVIVLPGADALFPLIQHVLAGIPEERYNIAFQYPLSRTPVNGFLTALLELVRTRQAGAFSTAAYVRFILHPYTKNIRLKARSDVTRILMHALERTLAGDRTKQLIALDEIEKMDELFTSVAFSASVGGEAVTANEVRAHMRAIHDQTIRPLLHLDSVRTLARAIVGILSAIYDTSTAHLHPLFRPYADSILQEFVRLEHSLIGSASFSDVDGYVEFVRHIVDGVKVPFPGTPLRGLQVLGVLETRGLQFDHVYVLQVSDETLPGGMGSDMLLPQKVREALGLETVKARDELAEYYFRLLTAGAKTVDLFFSESGRYTRSRFVEKLLWERQQRDGEHRSAPYIRTVMYGVRLADEVPEAVEKTGAVIAVTRHLPFSASALDSYLHCPLQFYYRYVLRLREQEEVAAEVDMRDVGVFVHEVLKSYFAPFVGRPLTPDALEPSRMDAAVDGKFAERFGTVPPGALMLMRNQVRSRMRDVLQRYQSPICARTAVRIVGVEERFSVQSFGVTLTGTVDRIEERGQETVILDYKTGTEQSGTQIRFHALEAEDRLSWDAAIGSLQLPFYQLLVSEARGLDPASVVPAYLFLGEPEFGPDAEVALADDRAERLRRYRLLRTVIERLIQEINDPARPFLPASDLAASCPDCPFAGICGTQWVQAGARR